MDLTFAGPIVRHGGVYSVCNVCTEAVCLVDLIKGILSGLVWMDEKFFNFL